MHLFIATTYDQQLLEAILNDLDNIKHDIQYNIVQNVIDSHTLLGQMHDGLYLVMHFCLAFMIFNATKDIFKN